MFCRKCGKEIETNSLFCSQCGTKVESMYSLNEDTENNDENITPQCENSLNTIIENSKNSKVSLNRKKLKVPIILSIFVALILGYLIYFNITLEEASDLYYSGEYYQAGQKIKYLINVTFDDRYKTIKIAEQLGCDYDSYQTSKEIASDNYPFNYEYGLRRLISGFKAVSYTHLTLPTICSV